MACVSDWARCAPTRRQTPCCELCRRAVLTVKSARRWSVEPRGGQPGIGRLTDAGVLTSEVGRRNRAFEARELIDAFVDLERRLASPRGDTRVAPPVRRVSRRR